MSNLNFDLARALGLAIPNAQFFLVGNSWEGLDWKDERELPDEQTLIAALAQEEARLAGYLPDAEKYQVLDWLDDHGITSENVEQALQSIPNNTQRRKAFIRWSSINRVPADNAFVVHVAKQLNIDHKTAWAEILAK